MYFYSLKIIILKYFLSLFVVIIFLFSCDKKQENVEEEDTTKPLLSVVEAHSTPEKVMPIFNKDVESWNHLIVVEEFLNRFKKVSPNEILSNALELKILSNSLKDSLKPSLFEIPSLNARINIFYNETLRLADMTTIPSIEAEDVNKQTEKIISAFSAINAKVNTILSKKRFEEAIKIDVKFIGLDSTKMDSISRKTLRENIEKREQDKNDMKLKSAN